jgi:hypothetical protein
MLRIRPQLAIQNVVQASRETEEIKAERPRTRTSAGPAGVSIQRAAHDRSNGPAVNLAFSARDGSETVVVGAARNWPALRRRVAPCLN